MTTLPETSHMKVAGLVFMIGGMMRDEVEDAGPSSSVHPDRVVSAAIIARAMNLGDERTAHLCICIFDGAEELAGRGK
jgi:hypothetical protein